MDIEIADRLLEFGGEIYEDYSGRGMSCKTTAAIKVDDEHEWLELVLDFGKESLSELDEGNVDDPREIIETLLVAATAKRDSLGMGLIYY